MHIWCLVKFTFQSHCKESLYIVTLEPSRNDSVGSIFGLWIADHIETTKTCWFCQWNHFSCQKREEKKKSVNASLHVIHFIVDCSICKGILFLMVFFFFVFHFRISVECDFDVFVNNFFVYFLFHRMNFVCLEIFNWPENTGFFFLLDKNSCTEIIS